MKIIVNTILEELRSKGMAEAEIVKRYKFQKINGLKIDGESESQVNEILKTTLLQILGNNLQAD